MSPFARNATLEDLNPEGFPDVGPYEENVSPEFLPPPEVLSGRVPTSSDLAYGPMTGESYLQRAFRGIKGGYAFARGGGGEGGKPFESEGPVLTNRPETAQRAAAQGADVYFLSDRPETEEYLAQGEKPFKKIVRDVRAKRPQELELDLYEATKDFAENEGQKALGFNPLNGPELDPRRVGAEAAKQNQAMAKQFLGLFEKSWTKNHEERKVREAEPLVQVEDAQGNRSYVRRKDAVGKRPPNTEPLVQVQDDEGNNFYLPRSQAMGMAPTKKAETLYPYYNEKGEIVYGIASEAKGKPAASKPKAESEKEKEAKEDEKVRKALDKDYRTKYLTREQKEEIVAQEREKRKRKESGENVEAPSKGKLVPDGKGGFVYTR